MKNEKNVKLGIAILLPLIFFFASVSYVISQQDIPATLSVVPSSTIECKPDVLTKNSNLQWINCFIEFSNAPVSSIDITTVQLSVVSLTGDINAAPSFFIIGDFDHDGVPDAQVRFNRTLADQLWFNSAILPTTFNLKISGKANSIPFLGSDTITVVKTPVTQFSRYIQINSGDGGTLNKIEGVNLQNYAPSSIAFSGYFVSQIDPRIFGVNAFYSQGTLAVSKTINLLLFSYTFVEKQPLTIGAFMTRYDNCFGNSTTSEVSCDGSGMLIVHNKKTGVTDTVQLNVMRFEIKNFKAKIEGGNFWNDKFSVENIPITNIYFS
jgi:hypothetical protein